MTDRMRLEKIDIDKIVPNPLNPRQDYSVQTEEMQEIIRERGWETGITCYEKNGEYVILSGHRRWYAAKQLKERHVPVFVVEPPQTKLEELERLGSSQSGKVDWSAYEWARYTFDLWIIKDKPTYRELALFMGASESLTAARIKVFRYYPHHEIEKPLEEGQLSITMLSEIIDWIEKLKKLHPHVANELSVDLIRANMVKKAITKKFSGLELRVDKFIEMAEDDQLIEFIRNPKMRLKQAYEMVNDGESTMARSKIRQIVHSVERRTKEIRNMDADNVSDAKKLHQELDKLLEKIIDKKSEIKTYIN